MDYHQSLWVYGDNREPNKCRFMLALHPKSFRWFYKAQLDPRDAPGCGLHAWEPLEGEPPTTFEGAWLVRCHRQNGQVRFPRRASLPTDTRPSGWLKQALQLHPGVLEFVWTGKPNTLKFDLNACARVLWGRHATPPQSNEYPGSRLEPVVEIQFPSRVEEARGLEGLKNVRISFPMLKTPEGARRSAQIDMHSLRLHYPELAKTLEAFPATPINTNCRSAIAYKEDPAMTTANAAIAREQAARAALPADVRYIGVRFAGTAQTYTYLSQDQSIEVGDHALVMSPSGLAAVKVVSTNATRQGIEHAYKWLVSRVDPAALEAYKNREVRQAEIDTLNIQIERQRKQAIERLNERALAAADPELARLLALRDGLEGTVPAEKPAEASFGSLSIQGISKDGLSVAVNLTK